MVNKAELQNAIDQVTAKYNAKYNRNVPVRLVKAIIQAESSYNPNAVSNKGAIGLGQIMPETGADYGMTPEDLKDPIKNIITTVKHIDKLSGIFDDPRLVIAAYNAGQGNVLAANGKIPNFPETRAYVKKVGSIYNTLKEDLSGQQEEAVKAEGSPFKNAIDEIGARFQLGFLANQPELQKRFLEKRFGKGNVVEQDGSLFARENPDQPLRPVNRDTGITETVERLPSGAPITKFTPRGDIQDIAGDIAGAIPGALRLGADIGGGALGGSLGVGAVEGLTEGAILLAAKNAGLITDKELSQKAIDPITHGFIAGILTKGFDLGSKGIVGVYNQTIGSAAGGKTAGEMIGKGRKFLERLRAEQRRLDGSRVQDALVEKRIKDFAKGADPVAFASKVSTGLNEAYRKDRNLISEQFNKGRELSKADIEAKSSFNSQMFQERPVINARIVRGENITTPFDLITGIGGESSQLPQVVTSTGGRIVRPSIDVGLGQRPQVAARTSDFSSFFNDLKESMPSRDYIDLIEHIQAPLKNKVPIEQFTGSNLIDAEVAGLLEATTALESQYKEVQPLLFKKIATLKSAAHDSLESAGSTPAGKQFIQARNNLSRLENAEYPAYIKDIMAPSKIKPDGTIVFIDERAPEPAKVLSVLFDKTNQAQKGRIRQRLASIGQEGLLDNEAGKVAIINNLAKKGAVRSKGADSIVDMTGLTPEAELAAEQLSKSNFGNVGSSELSNIGKQTVKELETIGSKKNVGFSTEQIDKGALNKLTFGGGADDLTGELTNDNLSGLVNPEVKQSVRSLLGGGVESEAALKAARLADKAKAEEKILGFIPTQPIKRSAVDIGADVLGSIDKGAGQSDIIKNMALPESITPAPVGSTFGLKDFIQTILGQPKQGDEERAQRLRGRVQFNQI